MSWRIFVLPKDKQEATEEVLKDDILWRQTRVFREAPVLGGKEGELFLYLDGSEEAMARADKLIITVAKVVPKEEAQQIYTRIKEEQDNAAQGMGLLFAE